MASFINKLIKITKRCNNTIINGQQYRYSSYYGSPNLDNIEKITTKYEVTRDSNDWKYIERILPPITVPNPVQKDSYPSNWRPQSVDVNNKTYYISRTKNHMLPVYLKLSHSNSKRITYIKNIKGDIWLLEKEIREFLQKSSVKPIRSQVHEMNSLICIHGDHVNAVKSFLLEKKY